MTIMAYVTALAWLWGAFMAICLVGSVIPPWEPEDSKNGAQCFVYGIPAWAWLIAHYFMQ